MFSSFQLCHRPGFHVGFYRLDANDTDLALVLEWVLHLGWFEVRKFNPDLLDALDVITTDPEAQPVTITPRAPDQPGKDQHAQ